MNALSAIGQVKPCSAATSETDPAAVADHLGGRQRGRAVNRDRAEMPGSDRSERPAFKYQATCSTTPGCVTTRSAHRARCSRPAGGVVTQPFAEVTCSPHCGHYPPVPGPPRTGRPADWTVTNSEDTSAASFVHCWLGCGSVLRDRACETEGRRRNGGSGPLSRTFIGPSSCR